MDNSNRIGERQRRRCFRPLRYGSRGEGRIDGKGNGRIKAMATSGRQQAEAVQIDQVEAGSNSGQPNNKRETTTGTARQTKEGDGFTEEATAESM